MPCGACDTRCGIDYTQSCRVCSGDTSSACRVAPSPCVVRALGAGQAGCGAYRRGVGPRRALGAPEAPVRQIGGVVPCLARYAYVDRGGSVHCRVGLTVQVAAAHLTGGHANGRSVKPRAAERAGLGHPWIEGVRAQRTGGTVAQ